MRLGMRHGRDKLMEVNPKSLDDLTKCQHGHIVVSALHSADKTAVNPAQLCQFLLTQPQRGAAFFDSLANGL